MPLTGSVSPDDLRLFYLIHESGGISPAARRFGVAKATLSRALSRLEETAGSPLFDRVANRLRPTAAGEALLSAGAGAARAASEAADVLRKTQEVPSGPLRIAVSALGAQILLLPVLLELLNRYPGVEPRLEITGHGPDPLAADLDVVLRLGQPPEPYLITRKVISSELGLYAAGAIAEAEAGDPAVVPREGRVVVAVPGSPEIWELEGPGGRLRFDSPPLCVVGEPSVAVDLLRAGRGVALLPVLYADTYVARGEFRRLMPDHRGPSVDVYAAFPPGRAQIPAVRAFIDLLVEMGRARFRTLSADA